MLKYNIKLTDDNFKEDKLVWHEKYLEPNLSFVSGVTSQDYHLEKFNRLHVSNSLIDNLNTIARLETENVTRQGYIIIINKRYEVNKGSVVDYSVDSSGTVITYDYLFLNGKYYYSYKNEENQYSNFKIDKWLVEETDEESGESRIVEKTIEVEYDGWGYVYINTIVWIEDGIVNIDGHDYIFDGEVQIDEITVGGLKYYEDGVCLESSAITACDSIEYHPYSSTSEYDFVTKFTLTKDEETIEPFNDINYCKRFYYVIYKDTYLPIKLKEDENSGISYFKCEIPKYILGIETDKNKAEYYETIDYSVYGTEEGVGSTVVLELTGYTFDVLLEWVSYVIIEGTSFIVEHDIMNANNGKDVMIYLENEASNYSIGDRVRFVDASEVSHEEYVYKPEECGLNEDDGLFVLFNGNKYKVEANICDKVEISGNEYSIEYINGKIIGKDCLVIIGDEKVPMYINSPNSVTRYGKIISGDTIQAVTARYDIKPYSGITIDGKKYIVTEEISKKITEDEDDEETSYYVYLDRSNEFTFVVNEIKGSSMLICRLDTNMTDFNDEFNDFISLEACDYIVENKDDIILYAKNKIFGDKEITQTLAFQTKTNPTSSDDYYNLFDNLDVYTRNGYINIPLSLNSTQGTNILQDDIVNSQFFDDVKKRAINPIVDMEKDVYLPKYMISKQYNGSKTDFGSISQIRINLHFRTRDLNNWKVNDGYKDISTSGITDNWFIIDYHPYKNILNWEEEGHKKLIDKDTLKPCVDEKRASEILMDTSDLIGLLDFTNDDVYYQKNKIAKSFIRLSFYDSTDPKTQSLLSTSCIFMDEHRMFKRYIDNSRRNVNDYGFIVVPKPSVDNYGKYDMNNDTAEGRVSNKADVMTEFLGRRQVNKKTYIDPKNNPYNDAFSGTIIDNEHRIGSEFIVNNKYETDTSSEGFYIYMFREYSENLMPKPIYMKVEFNHAGIGKTIPFVIPMVWSEVDNVGNKYPDRPITLTTDDLEILKKGIKLADVYAQTYIPLYAVYDFKNKEYGYVIDDRYLTDYNKQILSEEGVLNLNLFELKIMDETTEENISKQQENITYKKQERAVINIDNEHFPMYDKECD